MTANRATVGPAVRRPDSATSPFRQHPCCNYSSTSGLECGAALFNIGMSGVLVDHSPRLLSPGKARSTSTANSTALSDIFAILQHASQVGCCRSKSAPSYHRGRCSEVFRHKDSRGRGVRLSLAARYAEFGWELSMHYCHPKACFQEKSFSFELSGVYSGRWQ